MTKNQEQKLRKVLSGYFSTVDADNTTGLPKDTKFVSRGSFLAQFEIDKIVKELA